MRKFKEFLKDKEQLKNLGLNGMSVRKYPHKKYNVKQADQTANSDIQKIKERQAKVNKETLERYYQGHGQMDFPFLYKWRDLIEKIDWKKGLTQFAPSSFEINWRTPDPNDLLVAADWLEDQGENAKELRNYAYRIIKLLELSFSHSFTPQRQLTPDQEEIDYNIDNPQ